MSSSWDDFKGSSKEERIEEKQKRKGSKEKEESKDDGTGCDWGFSRQEADGGDGELVGHNLDSSRFIPVYERYLEDKQSFNHRTKNFNMYGKDPQKAVREWFDSEGHEFSLKTGQLRENQYICTLDLPLDDHDFTLTSEAHSKKHEAIDEICMAACKLLDECQLLYPWQSGTKEEDSEKKRRLDVADNDDDFELDNTCYKRHCDSLSSTTASHSSKGVSKTSGVNTYESLMAKWSELNMSILQLKAKLVKLDLSVTRQQSTGKSDMTKPQETKRSTLDASKNNDGDDNSHDNEIDPLDEYMSNLETKTKLSMDEKIEKSRIKSQIAAYEREQSEVSRFIALAKPKFDLDKACPPTSRMKK